MVSVSLISLRTVVVGMKSRGVYETPGGTILMEAHKQLEELVIDRATMEVKKDLGNNLLRLYTKENGSHHFVALSCFRKIYPEICYR